MSSIEPSKEILTNDETKGVHDHHHTLGERMRNSISVQSIDEHTVEGQIYSMNDVDPALDKKMRLVNAVSLLSSLSSPFGANRDIAPRCARQKRADTQPE